MARYTTEDRQGIAFVWPTELQYFDKLPNSAYVSQAVVEKVFDYSSATLWREVRKNKFPKPCRLSTRKVGWNVGKLREKLAEIGNEPFTALIKMGEC